MRLFIDIFSGDELFTDAFKMELIPEGQPGAGVVYKVYSRMVTKKLNEDFSVYDGNAFGEQKEEDTPGEETVTVNEVVDAGELYECSFTKKEFMAAIKAYMKRVKTHLEENNPERVPIFMKNIEPFIKEVLKDFKEYQFFAGRSMDYDAMIVLQKFEGETPVLYFYKDGLREEKY